MSVLNVDLNKMKKKFVGFEIPDGRGDIRIVKKFSKRFKFIDESYNANPASMMSAIKKYELLRQKKKSTKINFFYVTC